MCGMYCKGWGDERGDMPEERRGESRPEICSAVQVARGAGVKDGPACLSESRRASVPAAREL